MRRLVEEVPIPAVPVSDVETKHVTQEQPTSQEQWWLLLAGFLVLSVIAAAACWILDHPYGIHWDEAVYFNNVLRDIHNLHSGSLRQLGSILIGGDIRRPPASLLVALPFLTLFGFHAAVARFVTLTCWFASACFIYLTNRRLGTAAAAAIAVLVFCLAPEVISASIFFSTEGPLFLAISMMLFFLSYYWTDATVHPSNWIGLGFAIGLGVLSKSTFVLIAIPALGASLFICYRNRSNTRASLSFFKAGVLGFAVAAPWWLKNLRPALGYALFAREQPRNSLGAPSLVTWAKWFITVVLSLIGPGLSILIALVAVLAIYRIATKRQKSEPEHRAALFTCGCAVVPLVALQLFGTNHQLRYLCPVMIPFAVAIGVLADATGWIRSRAALTGTALFTGLQSLMMVAPVVFPNHKPVDAGFYNGALPWRTMARVEQWDWEPLRDISQSCGLEKPKIAFLGMGRGFNPPQIEYPWFLAGESPSERDGFSEPLWLWRYEQGPINWEQVMRSAEQSDIVLTAPSFVGESSDREDLDNEYNREFAERLTRDNRFGEPLSLEMGRFQPVEVLVFSNKALACTSSALKRLVY